MRRLAALVAALVMIVAPAPALAHGGSYDMKYVDGSNVLLLTFNTHTPVSGLDIEHDLRLYDLLGAPITYDEVAVELHARDDTEGIALRGQTLLQEETVPMLATNESKLTLAYPVPGSYTLRVVFSAGGSPISSGEFAVNVDQGASGGGGGGFPWIRLGLTLLLGLFLGTLLPRRAADDRATSPDVPPDVPVDEEAPGLSAVGPAGTR